MYGIIGSLVMVGLIVVPNTKRADCASAGDRYATALTAVGEALRAYETCIASSRRRDDCAKQIEALDDAHEDFAAAVEDLKDCP